MILHILVQYVAYRRFEFSRKYVHKNVVTILFLEIFSSSFRDNQNKLSRIIICENETFCCAPLQYLCGMHEKEEDDCVCDVCHWLSIAIKL